MLSSSLNRPRFTNSWDSFAVEVEIRDIYNRVSGLCAHSHWLEFFMGVRTKAILWWLPLPPAQNWLRWNALIAVNKRTPMSSLLHGCALILYGVGIKTASVSSGRSAPRGRTQCWEWDQLQEELGGLRCLLGAAWRTHSWSREWWQADHFSVGCSSLV